MATIETRQMTVKDLLDYIEGMEFDRLLFVDDGENISPVLGMYLPVIGERRELAFSLNVPSWALLDLEDE